jgi:uncharacterized protein (TIGR02266 family)
MTSAPADLTPHRTDSETSGRLGRVALDVPVHLSNREGSVVGTTRNVSMGGMFVTSPRLLAIGERVAVRLSILDESDPVEIEAEVRWARRAGEGGGTEGMGLRFIEPLLQSAMFVRVLLRLREQGADI